MSSATEQHVDKYAVKAIVTRADGCVLKLRRSKTHPHVPKTSDIPGGTLDDGETPEAGLIREVREETSLEIQAAAIRRVAEGTIRSHGRVIKMVLYAVDLQESQYITLSYEHDRYEWVDLAELDHVGFFDTLIEEYKQSKNQDTETEAVA